MLYLRLNRLRGCLRLNPFVDCLGCRVLYLRLDRRARGILNKGVGHEVWCSKVLAFFLRQFVAAFEAALLRL